MGFYRNLQEVNVYASKDESLLRKHLIPGGFLIVIMSIPRIETQQKVSAQALLSMWKHQDESLVFLDAVWDLGRATIIHSSTKEDSYALYAVHVTKRSCTVNMASCLWKSNSKRIPSSMYSIGEQQDETWLQYERRIITEATISRTISEVNCQYNHSCGYGSEQSSVVLTKENKQQAVDSLEKHGFVIIPRLFSKPSVRSWAKAILSDFDDAARILLERDNIDILNPGKEGSRDPLSYKEMAMREDLRSDQMFEDNALLNLLFQPSAKITFY